MNTQLRAALIGMTSLLWNSCASSDPSEPDPGTPQHVDPMDSTDEPFAAPPVRSEHNTHQSNKHGAQGASTLHQFPVSWADGYIWDVCGDHPLTSWPCWWRWAGYNIIRYYYNDTHDDLFPRPWTLNKVNFQFCFSQLDEFNNHWFAGGSSYGLDFLICVPGQCTQAVNIDLTAAPLVPGSGGSPCRTGTVTDLNMTIEPGDEKHVEVWLTPKQHMPNPLANVYMNFSTYFTDGP